MKTVKTKLVKDRNNLGTIAMATGALLLIPFFGSMFVEGWDWSGSDFVIAGTLFFCTGVILDFIAKKATTPSRRLILFIAVLGGVAWLWAELAVGIFTNWGS